jgi:hypothetical protein
MKRFRPPPNMRVIQKQILTIRNTWKSVTETRWTGKKSLNTEWDDVSARNRRIACGLPGRFTTQKNATGCGNFTDKK